jgi:cytidylate kinase
MTTEEREQIEVSLDAGKTFGEVARDRGIGISEVAKVYRMLAKRRQRLATGRRSSR